MSHPGLAVFCKLSVRSRSGNRSSRDNLSLGVIRGRRDIGEHSSVRRSHLSWLRAAPCQFQHVRPESFSRRFQVVYQQFPSTQRI